MTLKYDPEFAQIMQGFSEKVADFPSASSTDFEAKRRFYEEITSEIERRKPMPADLEISRYLVDAADGHKIPVYRFFQPAKHDARTRKSTAPLAPAILHCHGGGMVVGSVQCEKNTLAAKVSSTEVQIFSVDYRLAPEHPHPTLVEDCYAALCWLHANSREQFGIDPARIAVMGESAGGGIAAGVALLGRDRGLCPPLAKQILIYPMLDDRNTIPNPNIEPFAIYKTDDNKVNWTALLGAHAGTEAVSPYAAPARVESVEGLPPTYMDLGDLDIFRDENVKYAMRLILANIQTELHLYPGVSHGFENIAPGITITKQALENRKRAVQSF
ncbi:alpha/beta hydrolase fold-domain-containing protein [Aspergillus pseudoustus]|uniref:Alpha/beta hydrolase fold-domain-containing protein n=1 Tax=Aspergillus pseudoustus TaxID=1810923 RepID=A0ABR4IQ90_9EURO